MSGDLKVLIQQEGSVSAELDSRLGTTRLIVRVHTPLPGYLSRFARMCISNAAIDVSVNDAGEPGWREPGHGKLPAQHGGGSVLLVIQCRAESTGVADVLIVCPSHLEGCAGNEIAAATPAVDTAVRPTSYSVFSYCLDWRSSFEGRYLVFDLSHL